MKYFCQLKMNFNFNEIKRECLELNKITKIYNSKLSKKTMKAISLMSYSGDNYDFRALPGSRDFLSTVALKQSPEIQKLLKNLPGKPFSVRLLCLQPRTTLKRHLDHFVGLGHGIIRLHLPILTTNKVIFSIEDENLHLKEGRLWFTDISSSHSVNNNDDKDRLHLVIDICLNQDYSKMFPKSFLKNWIKTNGEIEYFGKLLKVKSNKLKGTFHFPYIFQPDSLKLYETEDFQFKSNDHLYMIPKGAKDQFKVQRDSRGFYVFPTLGPVIKILEFKKIWYIQVKILLGNNNTDKLSDQTIYFPLKKSLN